MIQNSSGQTYGNFNKYLNKRLETFRFEFLTQAHYGFLEYYVV
jgi:hypothetical protein